MTTLIIIGLSVVAVAVFVVLPTCWLTSASHERWGERYWAELRPPATEDPGEWTGPLHTGGTRAEKRMLRYFHEHRQILLKRSSEAKRRFVAAVDGARRPGWMWWCRLRPVRHATWTAPVAEPPLAALPGPAGDGVAGQHDAPLPAPPALFEHGLADATSLGLLAPEGPGDGPGLPPAPANGGGETTPIGDTLAAEMGTDYAPDNTMWRDMRDELFAMLAQDGEVAS